jgi:uncharacterized membrane protein YphA (DoxX/SURF4 family)
MKIAVIIVRVLLGLLLLFSSLAYFFNLIPTPELSGSIRTFNEGMEASGYLVTLIKGTELICGLALVTGYFVPLALVVFSPLALNILCVHLSIAPEGIPVAIFVVLSTLFLLYAKRAYYAALFQPK